MTPGREVFRPLAIFNKNAMPAVLIAGALLPPDLYEEAQAFRAGYRAQVPPQDRWAIVAHVKALQFSQSVDIAEIPEPERKRLEQLPLPPSDDSGSTPNKETGTDSRKGR